MKITRATSPNPLIRAGMMPAANRAAIEMFAITPIMIRAMVGGIRVAVAPEAASRAVLNGSG